MAARELRLGWIIMVVACFGLVIVGGAMLVKHEQTLKYTLVFDDAQGLRVGDRVQLKGVDIGQVKQVTLHDSPARVDVAVSVDRDQAAKVHADSTGVISSPTIPNVSGQKIVEIMNPERSPNDPPPGPMHDGQTVQGLNGLGDVALWKLHETMHAGKDQLLAKIGELGNELDKARVEIQSMANSPQVRKAIEDLKQFMAEMQTKGRSAVVELQQHWKELVAELQPVLDQLREAGRTRLFKSLVQMKDQVDNTLRDWQNPGAAGADAATTATGKATPAAPGLPAYPAKPYTSR